MAGWGSGRGVSRAVWAPILLVAAVYLATLASIDRRGFWVLDNASKFIQMRAIEKSGYRDYWIPLPGRAIDPDLRLNPVPFPFAVYAGGNLYPVFSPVFAVVSSIPHRLFGMDGLLLLPFLCTLLALLGVARIAERTLQRRRPDGGCGTEPAGGRAGGGPSWPIVFSILAAGLCTPLWFYSAVFWEHAIAVCLCVWGLVYHLAFLEGRRLRDLAIGSALCAVAIWFRDELYLFVLVLTLNHLRAIRGEGWRAAVRVVAVTAAASAVCLAPLWAFQWWAIGRPFGFHLETHTLKTTGIGMFLSMRPRVAYNLLIAMHRSVPASLLLSGPLLLLFLVRPGLPWRIFRIALPALGVFAVLGTLVTLNGLRGSEGPVMALDSSNGLLACAPVLALGFLRLRAGRDGPSEPAALRWIHILAAAYAVVYVLFAHGLGSKGIHWGNRFLLVLYPLMAILAASNVKVWVDAMRIEAKDGIRAVGAGETAAVGPYAFDASVRRTRRRAAGPAIVLAIAVAAGLGAQIVSIRLLARVTDFSDRLSAAVGARPETVIVTDTFWLPEFIHREFLRRRIFLVRSEETMRIFRARLRLAGVERYLYLTARPDPPGAEPDLLVDDRGLKYYTVRGYEQSVGSGR